MQHGLGFLLSLTQNSHFHVTISELKTVQTSTHSCTLGAVHTPRDLVTSPLTVYNIPFNESFKGMTTGLESCSTHLSVLVPWLLPRTFSLHLGLVRCPLAHLFNITTRQSRYRRQLCSITLCLITLMLPLTPWMGNSLHP